jgi:hypothetical protein
MHLIVNRETRQKLRLTAHSRKDSKGTHSSLKKINEVVSFTKADETEVFI